jgi:hypothetical protein
MAKTQSAPLLWLGAQAFQDIRQSMLSAMRFFQAYGIIAKSHKIPELAFD